MQSNPTTWRQAILAHFTPKKEPMLLVIDPDALLRDDGLLAEIQNRNYDVLELDDEVSFRNRFERAYRSRWDAGEPRHVVVIVHTTDGERHIPYDLWQKSKRIELSVSHLFPNLNAIVVAQLDNAYYADLYPAHQQLVERGQTLRLERETIEFLLRAVFDLDPIGAGDPARWVEFLIHKHYSARELPPALETYVAATLLPQVAQVGLRADFLQDAAAFYTWLGEQWRAYVAAAAPPETLNAPGTLDLGDARLRPLLAHLFAEGLVARAHAPAMPLPPERAWMSIGFFPPAGQGLFVKEAADRAALLYALRGRLERLATLAAADLPGGKTDLRDWLNQAAEWAEMVYQANTLPQAEYEAIQPTLAQARQALAAHFETFIVQRYSAVHHYEDARGPLNLAAVNPWFRRTLPPQTRLALVCCDGLALDQWYLLRAALDAALPGLTFDENRTYAIAPTVTSISRQALFAGRPPTDLADTLYRTDQDAARWQAFWVNHDVLPTRIAYAVVQSDGQGLDKIRQIADGQNRRLGVLINLFDEVLHGIKGMTPEADKRVYYGALRAHLENGRLAELFDTLLAHDYRIFITSDHGNLAGVGIGVTPPKALIETYARRVAIFDDPALAQSYAQAHHLRHFWTKALPVAVQPVYLSGVQLFAAQGATAISHGGLSLEELVVPFVEVKR